MEKFKVKSEVVPVWMYILNELLHHYVSELEKNLTK